MLLLSLISNPNWILCLFYVGAACLNELALGAIVGFLGFIKIIWFGFNSRVLLGVQVKYSLACKYEIIKAFLGSVELF